MTRPEYDSIDQMIRAHEGDPNPAVLFEDQRFTWAEHVEASAARAALYASLCAPGDHIGYLFDNIPELSFWLGAGAVSGAPLGALRSNVTVLPAAPPKLGTATAAPWATVICPAVLLRS